MTAQNQSVRRETLQRFSNSIVNHPSLQPSRRIEHSRMDVVRFSLHSMLNGNRFVGARQIDENIRETERSTTREDDSLDRMIDSDVVDERRHFGGRESGRRIGVGREEDVVDLNSTMMSKCVVVGVCSAHCISSSTNLRRNERTGLSIWKVEIMSTDTENSQECLTIRCRRITHESLKIRDEMIVREVGSFRFRFLSR